MKRERWMLLQERLRRTAVAVGVVGAVAVALTLFPNIRRHEGLDRALIIAGVSIMVVSVVITFVVMCIGELAERGKAHAGYVGHVTAGVDEGPRPADHADVEGASGRARTTTPRTDAHPHDDSTLSSAHKVVFMAVGINVLAAAVLLVLIADTVDTASLLRFGISGLTVGGFLTFFSWGFRQPGIDNFVLLLPSSIVLIVGGLSTGLGVLLWLLR